MMKLPDIERLHEPDILRVCVTCGETFVREMGSSYKWKGREYVYEYTTCPDCRPTRREKVDDLCDILGNATLHQRLYDGEMEDV